MTEMPVVELRFRVPIADRQNDEVSVREERLVASERLLPGFGIVLYRGQVRILAQQQVAESGGLVPPDGDTTELVSACIRAGQALRVDEDKAPDTSSAKV